MVSLGRNFNMSSGAIFLSENNGGEDDRQPVLVADNTAQFIPLKTSPIFSLHLLISIIISFTGILLAAIWPDEDRCEAYFIMLYLRVMFWIITLIIDHISKYHHEKLRLNGYHDFHKSTTVHRGLPFYIVSLWNTAILALQTLMQHYYGEHFGEHCVEKIFSPIIYITIFSSVETIILCIVNGLYIGRVYKFNETAQLPDALRGSHHSSSGSVGLVQPGANLSELLEKQADLISYLKDHNLKLNQKLMHLNAQVRHVTIQN